MKTKCFLALLTICFLLVSGCTTSPGRPSSSSPAGETDLSRLGGFDEPLIPVGPKPSQKENEMLAVALRKFRADKGPSLARFDDLESFLKAFPHSSWKPSLRLNLGIDYHRMGRYSLALSSLQEAWQLMRDSKEPKTRALADLALGQWSISLAHLGRYEELEPLLKEARTRSLTGPSVELVTAACEGLYNMNTDAAHAFLCGPAALSRICRASSFWNSKSQSLLRQARSTRKGTSLHQVARLSESLGMSYQMAYREPGNAALITPAVAHWRVGHYACLFQEKDGLYSVADDTAESTRNQIRMTREVVNLEASGYFLVPAGPLPDGWRKVSPSEGDTVWGRGDAGTAREAGALTTRDVMAFTKKCSCSCGMTAFDVHAMLVSLSLNDVPVGGSSSAAFALPFPVNYAQRESQAPAVYDFSNFGSKWGSPWISWVEDYRAGGWISGIQLHWLGGGFENFDGKYVTANDPAGNVTKRSVYSHSVITAIPSVGYVRDLPDGSKETYNKQIGNRWFLTSKSDPQGNTISLQYDSQSRLSSITDSAQRVMVMGYQLADDPLKITQVTDPFGRSALFGYTNGLLTSVTDTLGLVSQYQYGTNDFIQSLTTPYGVTTFTHTDSLMDYSVGNSRVVTATDPAGRNYRVESRNDAPGIPTFEAVAPVGMPLNNGYLNFRNTFVWEPQQLGGTLDYTKATILHFMHGNYQWLVGGVRISGGPGRVLESYKKPLEQRVWFTYPNINNQYATSNLPTQVGHVEGDGSTHLDQYQYNGLAQMTQHTDPMGRVFDYQRAANDIDLLSVSTGGQTLFSATYDNQHNIKTLTSSSGGTSLYSYDSRGLIQSATNELGETTTYGHTTTGNLNSIQSPLNATTTFGYNAQEQLSSATDSEGYTVTASHDAADRPTGATYPDGTTDTITYDRLDVASTKDRKDRVTVLHHDGLRRLDLVTDANNGATILGYGLEDAPKSLTDPASRQTQFVYDLQQRLRVKQYGDAATQTMTYEASDGHLQSVTDALGHTKTFDYFLDDTLKSINYSGATPAVNFTNDPFLPRPLSMTDGQGVTTYNYVPVGSPGGTGLASVSGPLGDTAAFSYDIAGRMTGRTVNGVAETQTFDPLWRTTSTTNALDTFTMGYLGTTGQVTSVNSTLGPTMQYAYGTNIADRRLTQIKNLNRVGGAVTSQFDFTTNPVGEISQIIETHGGAATTPTPTPTNTTTPTPTHSPDDDEDEHGHGNGHGDDHGGNGHDNHGNGGHNDQHGNDRGDDRQHGLFFSPDFTRTGSTTLVLTLWGALVLYTLAQPRTRRTLVAQIASLGLIGALALNGCLVGTVSTGAGTTVTYAYSYDNLSQLIGVNINSTPAATFSFDPAGNLLSLTAGNTTTGFTANNLNQRTSPGVNVYDAKGQTTDKDGRIFEWDDDGRMTAIVDGTHRSEFAYDGYGRRIKIAEFDNGVITSKKLYWWLGGQIVTERDGLAAGFPIQKQFFSQGVIANGIKLFYTWDQLGSVRELIDSTGVVRADYRYDTYGKRTKETGDLDSDWGYAGLWHHGPSGLDLATYRTYDSAQGRWISRDPLGEGVDYNLYRYCGNNPMAVSDPSGLDYATPDAAATAALSAAGPKSRDLHLEFGGFIYRNESGRYDFTPPVPPPPGKNIGPDLEKAKKRLKSKCQIVATYHTHVYFKNYTNERFSDYDLLSAWKSKKNMYLMTVSGDVLKLDVSKVKPGVSNEQGMGQGVTNIGNIPLHGSPQTDQIPIGD